MTTRQRKLYSNLKVRQADEHELSIENERVRPPQRTAAVLAQQRREEERIAAIDAQRQQERRRTDPVTPYVSFISSIQGPFEPNYSAGQTSEQRLEQIIQILWTRVSELERDVEFLRER